MSVAKNIQYLQKLRSLLLLEYETEKEDFRLQSEKMPLARKIRRGICWHPVTVGRSYYNSLNQLVVEIHNGSEALDESDEDPDTAFEYGKPIQFFAIKADGQPAYFNWTSTISYVDGRRMVATVPSSGQVMQLSQTPDLGVQLYFDETSYKTMLHALDEVIGSTKGRLCDLRAVFSGDQEARKLSIPSVSMPWLNDSQQQAVHEVLRAKDVAVVHGPPGTGKTTTLVEAICETLHRETQVLVCAQSNTAVDWISEQLVDHGVSVLRIGNPSRVNDKMLSFTYERQFESHPDYPELWSIRKAIRQIRDSRQGSSDNRHQKLARLRERQAELEMRISHSLFAETRVVACTLVGAANKIMVGQKFSTLFIDEAAQALEPACWIAIRRAGRVILAGDHQQLPPTIKSFDAMQQGLGRTLMQRIVESQPDSVTLLTMQYRMNEAIMRFPSEWFYQGRLISHPSVGHRSVIDYDQPIVWVESDEPEQFVGESHGRINKAEADLLLLHLEGYINKVGKERFLEDRLDVGIISPYRVQTQYLRQQIHRRPFFKPFRNAITVQTVDGFQGQERDLILISLVRSNEYGQIGFLSDLRRMNVAMTRARMKLIIFGNSKTLSHYAFYRKLIEYIQSL